MVWMPEVKQMHVLSVGKAKPAQMSYLYLNDGETVVG